MKKVILFVVAMAVVAGIGTMFVPQVARAGCTYSCQPVPCGFHQYMWTRGEGDAFVTLESPSVCAGVCCAYLECTEQGCGMSASTVYLGGENVMAFDVRDQHQARQLRKFLAKSKNLTSNELLAAASAKFSISGERWEWSEFQNKHDVKFASLHTSCVIGK